ncbi:MAG: McrB family protein [Sulfurospirillum sp.]
MADYTKYHFNGKKHLPKNRLVLEVIKKYIQDNPSIAYSELLKVFPDNLQGSIGVLKNETDLSEWEKNKKDTNKRDVRFFTKNDEFLSLNNEKIYVCTEWGAENLPNFIEKAENIGYSISSSTEQNIIQSSIIDNKKNLSSLPSLSIKNILLYGVPGVGKTHNINKLISLVEDGLNQYDIFEEIEKNARHIDSEKDLLPNERIGFVTFHQNFGYEDFIEGFRPNEKGTIELQDGIFKSICQEARKNRDENYYLVIDEINRGNISKIFGELITLIEEDKRDVIEVVLPYSKKLFTIPSNVFIIGTMNSTDKSIALIDIALRRRFTFVKMNPNDELINHLESQKLFKELNQKIKDKLGEDYQIGHSYFMKIKNDTDLCFVLKYKIKPLLEEYFYGDTDGLNDVGLLLKPYKC